MNQRINVDGQKMSKWTVQNVKADGLNTFKSDSGRTSCMKVCFEFFGPLSLISVDRHVESHGPSILIGDRSL